MLCNEKSTTYSERRTMNHHPHPHSPSCTPKGPSTPPSKEHAHPGWHHSCHHPPGYRGCVDGKRDSLQSIRKYIPRTEENTTYLDRRTRNCFPHSHAPRSTIAHRDWVDGKATVQSVGKLMPCNEKSTTYLVRRTMNLDPRPPSKRCTPLHRRCRHPMIQRSCVDGKATV